MSTTNLDIRYWLIWSREHGAWWAANSMGYTKDRSRAGRYEFHAALEIVVSANQCLRDDEPNESMCPAWEAK